MLWIYRKKNNCTKYLKPYCTCHNKECKYTRFCGDYERPLEQEDIQRIQKLIDSLGTHEKTP